MGGKIVRRVVKARRRLDKMEWEQDSWQSDDEPEVKEQPLMLPTKLEERMNALQIDKGLEVENQSGYV